eukprot:2883385-Pleurochrysis_carterae.AAC.1
MRARSEALARRLSALLVELGLARLLLRQARPRALLQHGHLEALRRPLVQQLPLILAVGALAHPGRGAVGVAKDDARTRVVAACSSADVLRAPMSKEALSARAA